MNGGYILGLLIVGGALYAAIAFALRWSDRIESRRIDEREQRWKANDGR